MKAVSRKSTTETRGTEKDKISPLMNTDDTDKNRATQRPRPVFALGRKLYREIPILELLQAEKLEKNQMRFSGRRLL